MNLTLNDNYGALDSWGDCEATATVNTILSRRLQSPWIVRGVLPQKHYYNCSQTSDVCDHIADGSASTVVERPVPVALNKLSASRATIDTLHLAPVNFSGSITPDSLTVRGVRKAHPFHVTLWQWIGADSTRNPTLAGPGCTTTLLCTYTPPESGRMVLKVFVGGWEQTSSTTVQCVMYPADSMLNDSTNNFKSREDLLDLLAQSNADSSSKAGWNGANPKGWRHEVGGVIWKLPNGAGFQFVPSDDPNSTACRNTVSPSEFDLSRAPVPGAIPYAGFHSHPNLPGDTVYGCPDSARIRGVWQKTKQSPYDPSPFIAVKLGSGPSNNDMDYVEANLKPEFIMEKSGLVWRADPPVENGASPHLTVFRANKAMSASQRRCTWVKKYQP